MSILKVILIDAGARTELGQIRPDDPPGSIADHATGRREVIMFANHGDHSTISRSVGGADVVSASAASPSGSIREIVGRGFEPIRQLAAGETHQMTIRTERMTHPVTVRFEHIGIPTP